MDDVADGVGVDTVGSGQGSDRGKAGSAADGVNGLPIQFVEGVVFGGSGCHEGILLYGCLPVNPLTPRLWELWKFCGGDTHPPSAPNRKPGHGLVYTTLTIYKKLHICGQKNAKKSLKSLHS